jgi:threonine-phosphate decarboxylase
MIEKIKEKPPHGGDIYTHKLAGGPMPLDFSANISPLGLPEGVRQELTQRIKEYEAYPDPYNRELTCALSEKHGVPSGRIVCGAGSADVIFRLTRVLSPPASLVTAPAFSEYETALTEAGSAVSRYQLIYPGFEVRDDIIPEIKKADMVFLCNPNNPTGVLTPREMIIRILESCRDSGAILVLDECFMDLTDDPVSFTAESLLRDFENLIILKAFTKNYAMAGLRLGYALCGSGETAGAIKETGPPWSVSVPAQIAGVRALKETGYIEELRDMIKRERERLKEGLKETGIEVLGGSANYVFFRCDREGGSIQEAEDLSGKLASRGILIRDCSNFKGLENGVYFRAAVRLPEENDRFLHEIKVIMEELK